MEANNICFDGVDNHNKQFSQLKGHMYPAVEKSTPRLLHVQQASVHMVRCSAGLSKKRGLPGVHVEQSRGGAGIDKHPPLDPDSVHEALVAGAVPQ